MHINPYRLAAIKNRVMRWCGWAVLHLVMVWVGLWLLSLLIALPR